MERKSLSSIEGNKKRLQRQQQVRGKLHIMFGKCLEAYDGQFIYLIIMCTEMNPTSITNNKLCIYIYNFEYYLLLNINNRSRL